MNRLILGAVVLLACALVPQIPLAQETNTSLRTDAVKDFLPEGLEWDAAHQRFLLSSIRLHRIDAIDAVSGHATHFADAPGSVLGLHIGKDGQTLWAAWTMFAGGFKHNRGTGIVAYSLNSGKRLGNWPLPDKDPLANLGDLLVLDAHTIITSDSGTGAIYRFDTATHKYAGMIAAGQLKSPQGIAAGGESGSILVAEYSTGIWRVALADGAHRLLAAPKDAELRGIDGLYRVDDHLIGVQNGTRTHRILSITLGADDAIIGVAKLAEGKSDWDEPSLGTFVGARLWFNATSQWSRFDDELRALPDVKLQSPLLDSVALPSSSTPSS